MKILKILNEYLLFKINFRLVQRINSLEETVKRYADQYTTDLAVYTSVCHFPSEKIKIHLFHYPVIHLSHLLIQTFI